MMRIVISAPKQSCSSRRFQADAHSPVPLCASPEKRVSAQRAALSARSLYTVNAARRAVQKPGICASSSQRRNRAALRDGFKQKHTPPFRSAHRRKNRCPHRERLQRRAPYITANAARRAVQKPGVCASPSQLLNRLLFATVSSRSALPPFRSAHRRKSGCPRRERLRRRAPYAWPTPLAVPLRSRNDAHRYLSAETVLLFATISSRCALPRSDLRIAGKAGVRTESGFVGALLMKKQFRNPCPAKAPMRAAF